MKEMYLFHSSRSKLCTILNEVIGNQTTSYGIPIPQTTSYTIPNHFLWTFFVKQFPSSEHFSSSHFLYQTTSYGIRLVQIVLCKLCHFYYEEPNHFLWTFFVKQFPCQSIFPQAISFTKPLPMGLG